MRENAVVVEIVTDPEKFQRWWTYREPAALDRKILRAAIDAGFVRRMRDGTHRLLRVPEVPKAAPDLSRMAAVLKRLVQANESEDISEFQDAMNEAKMLVG